MTSLEKKAQEMRKRERSRKSKLLLRIISSTKGMKIIITKITVILRTLDMGMQRLLEENLRMKRRFSLLTMDLRARGKFQNCRPLPEIARFKVEVS
jgi:hypothetical protein